MRTVSERSLLSVLVLWGCAKEYEIMPKAPEVDPGDVTPCGFTEIPGTGLQEYDCNPVFDGSGEEWGDQVDNVGFHTVEILGHPFYQIWYTARPEGSGDEGWWGMGYAISDEGTAWEAHPANPVMESDEDAWDADGMSGMDVVWDPNGSRYVLTYQGYKYGGTGLRGRDLGRWGLLDAAPGQPGDRYRRGRGLPLHLLATHGDRQRRRRLHRLPRCQVGHR